MAEKETAQEHTIVEKTVKIVRKQWTQVFDCVNLTIRKNNR